MLQPQPTLEESLFYMVFFLLIRPPPRLRLFPYTTLFRSRLGIRRPLFSRQRRLRAGLRRARRPPPRASQARSEEHTSELPSLRHFVYRLLLEKKKKCNSSSDVPTAHTVKSKSCYSAVNPY